MREMPRLPFLRNPPLTWVAQPNTAPNGDCLISQMDWLVSAKFLSDQKPEENLGVTSNEGIAAKRSPVAGNLGKSAFIGVFSGNIRVRNRIVVCDPPLLLLHSLHSLRFRI